MLSFQTPKVMPLWRVGKSHCKALTRRAMRWGLFFYICQPYGGAGRHVLSPAGRQPRTCEPLTTHLVMRGCKMPGCRYSSDPLPNPAHQLLKFSRCATWQASNILRRLITGGFSRSRKRCFSSYLLQPLSSAWLDHTTLND